MHILNRASARLLSSPLISAPRVIHTFERVNLNYVNEIGDEMSANSGVQRDFHSQHCTVQSVQCTVQYTQCSAVLVSVSVSCVTACGARVVPSIHA